MLLVLGFIRTISYYLFWKDSGGPEKDSRQTQWF